STAELYVVEGPVGDARGSPGGGKKREGFSPPPYPGGKWGGTILPYRAPRKPPLPPNYEFLTVPAEYRTATKLYENCNYLQGNEGNIDPVHLSFLHQCLDEAQIARRRMVPGSNSSDNTLLGEDITPTIEVEI